MGNFITTLFNDPKSIKDEINSNISKIKIPSIEDEIINSNISKINSKISKIKIPFIKDETLNSKISKIKIPLIKGKKKESTKKKGSTKIIKKEKEEKKKKLKPKKSKSKSKKISIFNPISLFIDRTPKELDDRVKKIVKAKLKENPKMSDEELTKLISDTTLLVVEELASECQQEYSLVKTILSPKYGNGKWPSKLEVEQLIELKNFPWLLSQIDQWPEERDITSCQLLSAVLDKIKLNNRCIYSIEYSEVSEPCNVSCGIGTEKRKKKIVKQENIDFPSFEKCEVNQPSKEFACDTDKICKEDCKIEIDIKSFGEARCSKPCDSGDGPGEKTYKVKYVSSSKGEYGDRGSCDIDEEGKVEGETYDVTVKCNETACPTCSIKSKGPYKDDTVDFTRNLGSKVYTACLMPKQDGTFKDVDCGGGEGGFNYTKGARSMYNVTYNVTQDEYNVQNCTIGESTLVEACPVHAFKPNMEKIVKSNGEILTGGGEPCGNECVLSEDYPELVKVQSSEGGLVECSKKCGGGKKRMRKVVKSKSDAPYCPCKNDPSQCPFEEIDCNTQECIAPCVYRDGEATKHVQINDLCPGVQGGVNKHVVWDTKKVNPDGGKGMWYDSITNKYHPRNHFVKKMRVPTKKPPVGKGLCYQGDKKDKILPCSLEGTEKPIHAQWGPWKFASYVGEPDVVQAILQKYKKWNDPSNPNLQSKIEKRIQDRLAAQDKDPVTGEILTEDRIRKEENHCVDESYIEMIPEFYAEPGIRYTRSVQVHPQFNGNEASGPFTKTIPYMKKSNGDYTKYCPIDKNLSPEVWEGDGDDVGAPWDEDKCYSPTATGNRRDIKYTVQELEQEATKSFTRDVNLPEYSGTRTGEKRIIGHGTRGIYRYKTRDNIVTSSAKYGGLYTGKWHTVTNGMTSDKYDKRVTEYDECEGVRTILNKINKKIDNNPDWKSDNIVLQKHCNPIYDWDGKYYTTEAAALETKNINKELIRTHTDTGRKDLVDTENYKHPYKTMKRTTNSKFLTNDMHPHCQKPGLDSNTGWCGGKSTDDFIQMVTVSGGIEMIKGVVTKGRGDNEQWVKTFEVYVSRNGDSWKQVKNASGSTTFTGNTKDTRNTAVKNYFQNRVEAKYIRFVTKTWEVWNSMRIGYIEDLSGTVDCNGGDGIQKGEPWLRLTFNEAKTRESGGYSEGTHSSTKVCPQNNTPLVYQKGGNINTEFENIKLHHNGKISKKHLQEKMSILTSNLPNCGTDAKRAGWRSSTSSGASFGWTDCVKPNAEGLATTTKAFHADDGGFQYMYNYWSSTSNQYSDYKKWSDDGNNKVDSNHSSTAVKNGAYEVIPKKFTNRDYYKYNIIRQPCYRGTKGELPTLGNEWTSTIPASQKGGEGWKGKVWNIEGGTEGWIDRKEKYTWSNKFHNTIATSDDRIKVANGEPKGPNNYKIVEVEGTNNNKSGDHHTWSDGSKAEGGHIGGNRAYHNTDYSSTAWSSKLDREKSCAKYYNATEFYPVGIRIQRRKGTPTQAPTVVKLAWDNEQSVTVTLGEFPSDSHVKTILIEPSERSKTNNFKVYSRHGYNSEMVSFRINYLIGKPGKGYSIDKGKKEKNINPHPVDCTHDSGNTHTQVEVVPGSTWVKDGNCYHYSGNSGTTGEFKKRETRARRIKSYTIKDPVAPKHGGKNDCVHIEGTPQYNYNAAPLVQISDCILKKYDDKCCREPQDMTESNQTYGGGIDEWSHGDAARRDWLCRKRMAATGRPYCDIVYGWASYSPHVHVPGSKWAYMMKTNDKCPLTVSTAHCGPMSSHNLLQRAIYGGGKALRWE